MSLYDNFENVAEGDEVMVRRGRGRQRIAKVYRVTPKQFRIDGFGPFWKHNGKGVGDADSWYGSWANHIEPGDKERIAAESARLVDSNTFSECRVRDLSDDELAAIACIIRACQLRREGNAALDGETLGPVLHANEQANRGEKS